ncbi:MAG: hypothetical protein L3K11_02795 [Thermoplasmata archaeon]|nr:hypothetical protein [Thermoplasmata archaeon]
MTGALPSLENLLFPYLEVAGFMVGINVYLLTRLFPRPIPAPTMAAVVLVVGLFVVGLSFWAAVIYSVVDPGDASTVAVFLAVNSMMAVAGCWLLAVFWRAEERHVSGSGWGWPLLLALLLVGNELLMGAAFAMTLNGPGPYLAPGVSGIAAATTDGVVSFWFFGAMFATMVAILLLLPLARTERRALLGFSLTSLVGPWVAYAPLEAAVAMAAVMGAVLYLLLQPLRRPSEVSSRYGWLVGGILLGFGGMGLGEVLALVDPGQLGGTLPFALATLLVMGGEVAALARWAFSLGPAGPVDAPAPSVGPVSSDTAAPSPA